MMINMILLANTSWCKKCRLCYEDDLVKFWCAATAKPIPINVVTGGGKPEWCTLKEVPNKLTSDWKSGKYERGYTDGWNDCMENILRKDFTNYVD